MQARFVDVVVDDFGVLLLLWSKIEIGASGN
jgi:hypothetical protein